MPFFNGRTKESEEREVERGKSEGMRRKKREKVIRKQRNKERCKGGQEMEGECKNKRSNGEQGAFDVLIIFSCLGILLGI